MSDTEVNTAPRPDRQPWSAAELDILNRIAPRKTRKAQLLELFPGRTIGAIRQQLHQARDRLGLVLHPASVDYLRPAEMQTTMLDPNDPGRPDNWQVRWRENSERAGDQYLAALQRLAA